MVTNSLSKGNRTISSLPRPRKRLFLTLILISLVIAAVSGYGVWRVSFLGLATISEHLPLILGMLLAVVGIALAAGIGGIILAILGFPAPSVFLGLAWSAINMMFPLAIGIGRFFEIEKERTERSFIELSNHLVRQKHIKVKPEKLLILIPHCIQNESCPVKITRDVHNCRSCGKCKVGSLLKLTQETGVNLAVSTGGTLARKIVADLRPQAVLAIACERDLTTGIQDIFPLPTIGILNERPEGPCCNTDVDLSQVETAVRELLQ